MRQLTLCKALFALLFIGKIGHIGTLGDISWLWVFLPLLINYFVAGFQYIAKESDWKGITKSYLDMRKYRAIQKKYPEIYKNSVEKYKQQLQNENKL